MVAVAVGTQEKEQGVLIRVHAVADALEGARKVGGARDRKFLERVLAAHQRDGMAGGAEALVELLADEAHLVNEDFLARVRRKADEVKLALAALARSDRRKRALDELSLQMEDA